MHSHRASRFCWILQFFTASVLVAAAAGAACRCCYTDEFLRVWASVSAMPLMATSYFRTVK